MGVCGRELRRRSLRRGKELWEGLEAKKKKKKKSDLLKELKQSSVARVQRNSKRAGQV